MNTNKVLSPVTGSVWKVDCSVGLMVNEGDVLMTLESMKMEIPIKAPVSGTVESLEVSEGDAVEEESVVALIAL